MAPPAELELEIAQLALAEAEIEADPLQLLHVTLNLAAAAGASAEDSAEEAAEAKGGQISAGSAEAQLGGGAAEPRGGALAHAGGAAAAEHNAGLLPKSEEDKLAAPNDPPAPSWAKLLQQALGTDGTEAAAEHFWATPTHPPVAALLADAERLRSQLVGERSAVQLSHRASLSEARGSTEQALGRLRGGPLWLGAALSELGHHEPNLAELLRERVHADASLHEGARARCASWSELVAWLSNEQSARHQARAQLHRGLDTLPPQPSAAEVWESGNCAQCRSDWGRTGPRCRHCALETHLLASEELLFFYRRQRRVAAADVALAGEAGAGANAANTDRAFREDAHAVAVLKLLARGVGAHAATSARLAQLHQQATAELELLSLLQKELRCCRQLWMSHFDLLSQLDELSSAVKTMQLAESVAEVAHVPEAERHVFVGRWEIEPRSLEYRCGLEESLTELRCAKGHYAWLRRAAARGDEEDECPVCMSAAREERMVAGCGHSICAACADAIRRRRAGRFVCPLCQQPGELRLASALRCDDGSSAGSRVLGSWGTKVTAVLEQVLALPEGDKCLVFSQWDSMLALLSKAFALNGVEHRRLVGLSDFDSHLEAFKKGAHVRALLMPLRSGANGITLTVAQHVMIVEPLLNTALEAQAIGRVHRISQQRPTTTHRFITRNTIEEAIFQMRTAPTAAEAAEEGPAAVPSPRKRARHAEEAKVLSWEQLRTLFSLE